MANRSDNNIADMDTLIQFLNVMNQNLLSQSRSTNNTLAQLLPVMNSLQRDIKSLVDIQQLTREKRFEEEIEMLERQISILSEQAERKKTDHAEIRSTTDKVKAITQAELSKDRIDWKAVKQTMVNASAGALAIAIVWGIVTHLPEIGIWIKAFLGK